MTASYEEGSNKKDIEKWIRAFENCRLSHIYTYFSSGGHGDDSGAFRNRITIRLSDKGWFTFQQNLEILKGDYRSCSGSSKGNKKKGAWTINPLTDNSAALILTYSGGKMIEYKLVSNEDGSIWLNGERFCKSSMSEDTGDL